MRGPATCGGRRIITKALPGFHQGIVFCLCQGFDIGEAFKKTPIVGNDGGRPGLLQHDFGNPYAIRVAGLAPGQLSLLSGEPFEQRFDQSPVEIFLPDGAARVHLSFAFHGHYERMECSEWFA